MSPRQQSHHVDNSTTHDALCAPICPSSIYSVQCGDPHAWSEECTVPAANYLVSLHVSITCRQSHRCRDTESARLGKKRAKDTRTSVPRPPSDFDHERPHTSLHHLWNRAAPSPRTPGERLLLYLPVSRRAASSWVSRHGHLACALLRCLSKLWSCRSPP